VPGKLQSMGVMVEFIRSIILDSMGKEGMRFFPSSLPCFSLFSSVILSVDPRQLHLRVRFVVTARVRLPGYGLSPGHGIFVHG